MCPCCGRIKTKARCVKYYKWRGGKSTKFSNHKNIQHHLKTLTETTTTAAYMTPLQCNISPELATATAEQTPQTAACTYLQPEAAATAASSYQEYYQNHISHI